MKKEKTYVNRQSVRQLEDTITSILGENVGLRKTIDKLKNLMEENRNRIKKFQLEKSELLIGKLRGVPREDG